MPKGIECSNCGHRSVVRSNFKGLSDGRFYCNSVKRPECEALRVAELKYDDHRRNSTPSFGYMQEWRS